MYLIAHMYWLMFAFHLPPQVRHKLSKQDITLPRLSHSGIFGCSQERLWQFWQYDDYNNNNNDVYLESAEERSEYISSEEGREVGVQVVMVAGRLLLTLTLSKHTLSLSPSS